MNRERGELLYKFYRAVTYSFSPLIRLHLRWRQIRGLEHLTRWPERLGYPSIPRPLGPLLWFHAVSLGEGMVAMKLIKRCVKERPDLNVLMTTTTVSAFEVLKNLLPAEVIYQFAPVDVPSAVDAFLGYWKPDGIILVESELWPNLVLGASKSGISLALINARISEKSLKRWAFPIVLPLITLMLSKFNLIAPLSMAQGINFQLLQAPPFIISSSADLKYSVDICDSANEVLHGLQDLRVELGHRVVWMASSIHKGEEKVILRVHKNLVQVHPNMVTIIVPRHPQHCQDIASFMQYDSIFKALKKEGLSVALRSLHDKLTPEKTIYLVDTLGELRCFYRLTPIAVVGGSFLPGLAGHNISEPAAAGCAILTGPHVGQFSHMVSAMKQQNPLAVLQVSGELELVSALNELLSNHNILEARRSAANKAFHALSIGVVSRVWNPLRFHVLERTGGLSRTCLPFEHISRRI